MYHNVTNYVILLLSSMDSTFFLSQQLYLADIANMYFAKFDKYTRKG